MEAHESKYGEKCSTNAPAQCPSSKEFQEHCLSTKGFHAEELCVLAEYAGRVAHDFNNTIQVLLSGVQFVLEDDQSTFSYESHLILNKVIEKLKAEGNRVRHILDFSGGKRKCVKRKASLVNLCSLIEQALEQFKCELGKRAWDPKGQIIFETRLCKNCMVNAGAEEIRNMMMCLLTNSAESMPDGGKISVSAHTMNNSAVLEVTDEGCGVDPKDLIRIFQPYWTTKNDKERGIGLSTVYGLAKALDGAILVDSQIDKGTRISVQLPLSATNKKSIEPKK